MRAVAMVESSGDPNAYRDEPNGKRSIGLTQVLCPSRLNIDGWCDDRPCNGGCEALYDPHANVTFGARIMRWNLDTYGYPRGVAGSGASPGSTSIRAVTITCSNAR